ncbi:hypothetical protein DL764_010770 [Monosporascus ibericus]|uniref:Cytochrome P450 monooxygenase n=1 Tax=Monosporascus ibericus TaxID=155417 RepID=A0A4V1X8L4_9PEZI|nr:hypothetical protein DL764_010770 [Monosporascus ibericus]
MRSIFNLWGATDVGLVAKLPDVKFLPGLRILQLGDRHTAVLTTVILPVIAINAIMLAYWILIYPTFISPIRNLPKPKWFLARLVYSRFVRQETQGQLFADIVKDTPNDGLLSLPDIAKNRLLVTTTPLIADLLVHHPYDFIKPQNVRNFMRHFLGDGLIIAEAEQHKFLRKNSQRAFNHRHIQDLYPMMWKKAVALGEEIEADIRRQQGAMVAASGHLTGKADMSSWASKVTFDVIGIAGLGHDFNLLQHSDDQLAQDYEAVTGPHMLLYFVLSMWLSFRLVQMLPWEKERLFKRKTKSLKQICRQLIRRKKEAIEEKGDEHFDILSLLIKSGNFSDSELSDQLLTYLVAGHDTASATLTWACYLLAQHPTWQGAVRNEVRTSLSPEAGDKGIANTLESLPVLNGVLNETLRLFPTVPVTTRVAACDTTLGGQPIPKGTEVLLSPWLINRSPSLWGPTAGTFDPNRWVEDGRPNNTGGSRNNYQFMTFLHGPRSCIGRDFAKAELRCLLAAVAYRFEWKLGMDEKDVIPAGAITIKPQKGLHLSMKVVEPGHPQEP